MYHLLPKSDGGSAQNVASYDLCYSCDSYVSDSVPNCYGNCENNCVGYCHAHCTALCVDNCSSNCSSFCDALGAW